jgi:DNA-binding NtrC family response regulator
VEDDPDVRPILEQGLVAGGYTVAVAANVAEAMVLLDVAAYDIVLTDGRLPDGTGIQVADAAHSRGMKALIITGWPSQQELVGLDRYDYLVGREEHGRGCATGLLMGARSIGVCKVESC